MRTVKQVIASLSSPNLEPLSAPLYMGDGEGMDICLGVESMKRHVTDEGWQLVAGLQFAGYLLCGKDLLFNETDVPFILARTNPATVVVQDKREWEGLTADRSRDKTMRFRNVGVLRERPDIFKGTILKDAQHNPNYHHQSAEEIGCHFWLCYYHPDIVCRLAPYVRRQHIVRTYHTLDRELVPPYTPEGRQGSLLSGAVSSVYPLRQRLVRERLAIPGMDWLKHPGYHRKGCATPEYLRTLSRYKVAICTSSIYGYALRKLIEASACGCVVVTDLPVDEVLPEIDGNLVRVDPGMDVRHMAALLRRLEKAYDPEKQQHYAQLAQDWYDYRIRGVRLAEDIETMRKNYAAL